MEGAGPLLSIFRAFFGGKAFSSALVLPFLAVVFGRFSGDDDAATSPPSFSHFAKSPALGFSGFSGVVTAVLRDRFKARPSRPVPRAEALRCHPGPVPGAPFGAKLRRLGFCLRIAEFLSNHVSGAARTVNRWNPYSLVGLAASYGQGVVCGAPVKAFHNDLGGVTIVRVGDARTGGVADEANLDSQCVEARRIHRATGDHL